ncbi:MarR family winged helix-turn-helix transcriptional regulator [Psychrobacter sp. FME5]|uniref:MarR family winged helix-turn-helix transcriptional regulator n=1 Tax=Psychrobacter sp. FME5 TaxID=2487706 RepID=UPI00178861C5|nr:MarR family winged helix-turn-helix transcriptional regulator [Psychrobacter sp. FME5]MBE0446141.1 winged helix-turn-helix transcriptional regulator [Psychrobacter sp. FME5]
MKDSIFDFDKMLCFALYSTSNAMMRSYAKPLKEIGITYPQLLVLVALWEQNDVSVSTLSEKTLYDLGTLTPIIKRLESAGMIKVYLDSLDRRRRNVMITEQGLELKASVTEIFEDMRCRINLTDEEVIAALNIFRKIKGGLIT